MHEVLTGTLSKRVEEKFLNKFNVGDKVEVCFPKANSRLSVDDILRGKVLTITNVGRLSDTYLYQCSYLMPTRKGLIEKKYSGWIGEQWLTFTQRK